MREQYLELVAEEALHSYSLGPYQLRFLGNAGGFSGSLIWRVEADRTYCLKAWPKQFQSPEFPKQMHAWMGQALNKGISFTPKVYDNRNDGNSWLRFGESLWDLADWMPGQADFRANPSLARLRAACRALAQMHEAWSTESTVAAPPSVKRRVESARKWQEIVRNGWRPKIASAEHDPVSPVAGRIWALLPPFLPEIETRLQCWTGPRRLQPCLCDIWHDHVLFTGDGVTGIIDYGSMRLDTPAADLARMLGSLVGDDLAMWNPGFAAYREVRPLDEAEATLARVLDWTGVVLGAANWLYRLYIEFRVYEDRQRVARRMQDLLSRMEYFASSALWGKAYRCL